VDRIIDAHSHLGDILYPSGGSLIGKTGVAPAPAFDSIAISERGLHRDPLGIGKVVYSLMRRWITRAERARNRTATLENFARSMQGAGVTDSVCLPLPPHVTFADLKSAATELPAVIPFTGIDFSKDEDPGPALEVDVKNGARGLKLHPIIQNVSLAGKQIEAAVRAFSAYRLPVLFHCGVSSYYLGDERKKETPRYGEIHDAAALVRAFPAVRFIAGHAGLFEVRDVMSLLGGCPNVWVDTSIQSVSRVRQLISTFGPDRVLFGSDWPFGNRPPAVEIVKRACRGDKGLERRIFFENAAELLGVD
jgi:predicted TIM-barrel fold metal-dependent hydrolase